MDYNGDGTQDIVAGPDGNGTFYLLKGTDTGFVDMGNSVHSRFGGWAADPYGRVRVMDYNGDGKQDIVAGPDGNGTLSILASTGAGFWDMGDNVHSRFGKWAVDTYRRVRVMDYNGDGMQDIVTGPDGNGTLSILASTGAGFRDMGDNVHSRFAGWALDSYGRVRVMDRNGDGSQDIVAGPDGNGRWYMLESKDTKERAVLFDNTVGSKIAIDYSAITNGSIYTKGVCSVESCFPIRDIQAPMYVVSQLQTSNGIGGNFTTDYKYGGLKTNLQGRSLGFAWMESQDNTGIKTVTTYNQLETPKKDAFPEIGIPIKVETFANNQLVKETINTPDSKQTISLTTNVFFPYISSSTTSSFELGSTIAYQTQTTDMVQYDNYGNLTYSESTTNEGFKKSTTNTYYNNDSTWIMGKLTLAKVGSQGPGLLYQERTSQFDYDYTNGLLTKEVIEPFDPLYTLTTTYTHDSYGHRETATVSGADILTRTTTTKYEATYGGRFATKVINAKLHEEKRDYDTRFGSITKLTGPNNLDTNWEYDGFGRKIKETRADGTTTQWFYEAKDAKGPGTAVRQIRTVATGVPTTVVYLDSLAREVRRRVQGFDGRWIFVDTEFNNEGRKYRESRPYFEFGTRYWIYHHYDALGRKWKTEAADTSKTEVTYNGLTTTVTNDLGFATTQERNTLGQLVTVTDALSGTTQYTYDAFGNLETTTDANGKTTTMEYNIRGHKTKMIDPNMGTWTYGHNVLGELTSQTDAKSQTSTMKYDLLGRKTEVIESGLTSKWVYDSAAYGKGKLAYTTASNGFKRVMAYDNKGRASSETTTIDTTYSVSTTYDSAGRTYTRKYPSGFTVRNVYNTYGYLKQVVDHAAPANDFWTANTMDAEGNLTEAKLGNGLITKNTHNVLTGRVEGITTTGVQNDTFTFDTVGNLTSRYNGMTTAYEGFTYDGLNRVKTMSSSGYGQQSYDYDALGNLTSKFVRTGQNAYYTLAYNYTNAAKPDTLSNTVMYPSMGGPVQTNYGYDANGNNKTGDGRTITYTSWNKPATISKGGTTLTFTYDSDHMRTKKVDSAEGSTTIYLSPRIDAGLHYEKEIKSDGTYYKHYIYAGGESIAVRTTKANTPTTVHYFHKDHIGSTVATTDQNGTLVNRFSYDVWGKRQILSGLAELATHHGFTGHEMLESVGLVHMNGRIYDPFIGRFQSADPNIFYPDNTQGYNRYSYVMNNPLSMVDPSGYIGFPKSLRGLIKIGLGITLMVIAYPLGPTPAGSTLFGIGLWLAGDGLCDMGGTCQIKEEAERNGLSISFPIGGGSGGGDDNDDENDEEERGATNSDSGRVSEDVAGEAARRIREEYFPNGLPSTEEPESESEDAEDTESFDYFFVRNKVYSVSDGVVIRAEYQYPNSPFRGLGFRVSVSDKNGYYQYGHMDPDGLMVNVGDTVKKGDFIGGYADPTNGRSSGPHSHLERRLWSNPRLTVDPGSTSPLGPSGIMSSPWQSVDKMHKKPHGGVDWVYPRI
ncbi:MAG: FG-GAP-like repeat-containing protein, partial [Gammaproteobacteria bacterium]|nr:FG-GAP-like repeat-containing protein [Gammaproteobacteria bacterium]